MNGTNGRRAEHIGALVRGYANAVDALAASDDPESRELAASAFLPGAVADALGEALSTRAPFRPLASSPAFVGKGRRAAGSLWHRSVGWHGGGGNLWGLQGVLWDARSVGRRPEARGLPASWFVEVDRAGPDGFLESLETTACIYRLVHHGRSPAVAAWRGVLGTRLSA
jgi:hypothetical protein